MKLDMFLISERKLQQVLQPSAMFRQLHANQSRNLVGSFKQIQTVLGRLSRFRQVKSELGRFRQTQADSGRPRQIQADPGRFRQTQADSARLGQMQKSTCSFWHTQEEVFVHACISCRVNLINSMSCNFHTSEQAAGELHWLSSSTSPPLFPNSEVEFMNVSLRPQLAVNSGVDAVTVNRLSWTVLYIYAPTTPYPSATWVHFVITCISN